MRHAFLLAGLFAFPTALATSSAAQPASPAGFRAVVRLETRTSGPGAPPQRPAVEIAWTIQQGAVRSELLTTMGPLPKGTISVRRPGDVVLYVLDPGRKTYYRVNILDVPMPRSTSVTARQTADEETMAGRPARRVLASFELVAPPPPGERRGPEPEMNAAEEIWTTGPQASSEDDEVWLDEMERLVGVAPPEDRDLPVPFARTDLGRYVRFPLKIRATITSGPARVETTATVTSLSAETFPDNLFLVPPAGYREVPVPQQRPEGR